MSSLLASLPLFHSNMRHTQQQQQQELQHNEEQQQLDRFSNKAGSEQSVASAMLAAALAPDAPASPYRAAARLRRQQQRQQQQHVREWCQSWLDESAGRLASFTPQQLSATAAVLQKLAAYCCCQPDYPRGMQQMHLRWQQQRGARQLLTADWRRAYCRAVLLLLPQLDSAELVRLVGAAVALQMRPGRQWCAAVARQAAARAESGTAALAAGVSSSSSSRLQLQVHHVGLLAWYLRQLGFEPFPSRQRLLLQLVQAACWAGKQYAGSSSSRSSSKRRVKVRQLQLAVQLLRRAGWLADQEW
jgi:hypothetical protein